MKNIVFVFILFSSISSFSFADNTDLDPRYNHPPMAGRDPQTPTRPHDARLTHNDVASVIANQSPVKSQLQRGTCSIFSATALLESLLKIKKNADIMDLSEEWLQYVVNRSSSNDGSTSSTNFSAFLKYGMPEEELMSYIGETWKALTDSPLAQERCGLFSNKPFFLTSCLIVHNDPRLYDTKDAVLLAQGELHNPDFKLARDQANEFKVKYFDPSGDETWYRVYRQDTKGHLDEGIPLTLDLDFYYGAWNHRLATGLEIGRNMEHWEHGVVGYPEHDSADYENSWKKPAGHSFVIVGYDDNLEVTTEVLMKDGTTKKFPYKGVYYFKNSWGTGSFGINFTIDGVNYPGYGMITQKYAHEYGAFFMLDLKKKN